MFLIILRGHPPRLPEKKTKVEFFRIFLKKYVHNMHTQNNGKYLISSEKWEGVKIYIY